MFPFYFDRLTLNFKVDAKNGFLKEPESYAVLVAGDGDDRRTLDAAAQVTLRG
jgi:hypothetical protein